NRLNGKMDIIGSKGSVFFIGRLKKQISLVVGAIMFLGIIFYLSNFIWAVEIETKKNVYPFEIRQQLYNIGIKPGISKKAIEVKDIEKKLEDINSDILWLRVRIEGSTVKVLIEEKVNPPEKKVLPLGNLIARMDGQINRVYRYSGKSKVKSGDMVKVGDVIIAGVDGNGEQEFQVAPSGIVMANTFYEKSMETKISGTELVRSGKKDSDIYLNIFGNKIYLKKAIKDFKEYDKIEESGKIINKVIYFEREEKNIEITKEEAISNSKVSLEKSLLNELTREATIIDKIVEVEEASDDLIKIRVVFVVEQNIVDSKIVEY
ncbi:MAG: sporulation protein YqfD, partial [Clostridium sp.]